MREVVSISLDKKTKAKLDKYAKRRSVKRSVLVKEALNKYLIVEELKEKRNELRPYAEKQGFFSEEDLFKVIS